MKAVLFKTLRGNAIYYALDNRIELSNDFDLTKDFEISFVEDKTFCNHKIKKFVIELTQQCNLRCSYCCYSGLYAGMRKHSSATMSAHTIDKCISFILKNYDKESKEIFINIYGGESLLFFDLIVKFVLNIRNQIGNKAHFSISTNGIALSSKVVNWICSLTNIDVIVSVDGNKEMHDKHRKTKNGQGSYDIIIRNLLYFRETFPQEYKKRVAFLSTFHNLEEIEKLSDIWRKTIIGEKEPIFISLVAPNFSISETNLVDLNKLNIFYKKAFKRYISGESSILTKSFEKLISRIVERSMTKFDNVQIVSSCLNDMYSCYIDVEGNLYSCEKISNNLSIGDLDSGLNLQKMKTLNKEYINRLKKLCNNCWAIRLCPKCLINLNYSIEEQKQICKIEKEKALLALKYYCFEKDWKFSSK